ncbi:MAG TPA: peptidoglycan DD-metalloendopeptidase family protein, partial [Bryobacteraceae bacterium]|nr:peptidoglycan DD-metalloendopeptidase family protein [Bryobacteraceae bacterium]
MLRAVLAVLLVGFTAAVAFYAGRATVTPSQTTPPVTSETTPPSQPQASGAPSGTEDSRARLNELPSPPVIPPQQPSLEQPPIGDNPVQPTNSTPLGPVVNFEASIGLPIANLKTSDIAESFNDMRGGGERRHGAIDIMAPKGTPVVAVDNGIIKKLFTSKPGGLTIYQFDPREQHCYYYAHLDRYAPGVREGLLVKRGDLIGYVGVTGNSDPNAPHLHF